MLQAKIGSMTVVLVVVMAVLSGPCHALPLAEPVPTDLVFPGLTTAALTVGIPSFTIPAVTVSGGAIAGALAYKGIIAASIAKGAALAELTRSRLNGVRGETHQPYQPYQAYHH